MLLRLREQAIGRPRVPSCRREYRVTAANVVGIATAATSWEMEAIGGATGFGDYWLGPFLCLGNVLIPGRGSVAQKLQAALEKNGK